MIDRKDFVSKVKCADCPRTLTVGYIERKASGEVAYGPSCARKRFGSLKRVPDLTLHAKATKKGSANGGTAGIATPLSDAGAALRYMLLREERVAVYAPSISHPQLKPLLAKYRAQGHLTPIEVNSVLAIEASQLGPFRLKNLLDVHAAHHLISAKVPTTSSSAKFLASVLTQLHTTLKLTTNQLAVLNLGMPSSAFSHR